MYLCVLIWTLWVVPKAEMSQGSTLNLFCFSSLIQVQKFHISSRTIFENLSLELLMNFQVYLDIYLELAVNKFNTLDLIIPVTMSRE